MMNHTNKLQRQRRRPSTTIRQRRRFHSLSPMLLLQLPLLLLLLLHISSWSTLPAVYAIRLSIEGRAPPLFRCTTSTSCLTDILDQQAAIVAALQVRYGASLRYHGSVHRLINAVFVELDDNDYHPAMDAIYDTIEGVANVFSSEDFVISSVDNTQMQVDSFYSHPLRSIGLEDALEDVCVNGQGVRIGILDGGIDYTHVAMGGPGTRQDYIDAYGTSTSDARNRQPDHLFPTNRVGAGHDFLGDRYTLDDTSLLMAQEDDDPIDANGHGTAVAHAIRAVAPAAQLVAVKICTTTDSHCPDFAYLQGLEYILDPNQDGSLSDRVDIVNISIGRKYASSYYSIVSRAVEEVQALGVLPVLSAGNFGNHPFVLGGAPATPNAITVGATILHTGNYILKTMAEYSSRGSGDVLKPDVVAPGGPYGLAKVGTGDEYRTFLGTSFAAPLVTGAAALIKQECPECSPFAIKCLLMNYGETDVRYDMSDERIAPVSWQGAGEIQIQKSLSASFWAYSIEDANPSLRLGVINAASDHIVRRTIKITQLAKNSNDIVLDVKLRSNQHANAVTVSFSPTTITMDGECQTEHTVNVEFRIHASKAPLNRMSSGGRAGLDPKTLDWNEFDGWILLKSNEENDASLPFHMILRKASDATMELSTILDETLDSLPGHVPLGLSNHGAGTAHVDFYELIHTSRDNREEIYGKGDPPSDLRYVGYRTVESDIEDCDLLVEIAIQTWEKQSNLAYTHFDVFIDLDMDSEPEYKVFNSAYQLGSSTSEMKIQDLDTGETDCIGFVPDHATNSATTVLRFCTNHVGLSVRGTLNIAISSYSFPEHEVASDDMSYRKISLHDPGLAVANNYDIEPNMRLEAVDILGSGVAPDGYQAMGLMVVTNAYRNSSSTGAATTEVLVATTEGITLPEERTTDVLRFPRPEERTGPSCRWNQLHTFCRRRAEQASELDIHPPNQIQNDTFSFRNLRQLDSCPEQSVPRLNVVGSGSVEEPSSPLFVPALVRSVDSTRSENGETPPPLVVNQVYAMESSALAMNGNLVLSFLVGAISLGLYC